VPELDTPISEGYRSIYYLNPGNIADRTGRTLYYDPKTGLIRNDPEAAKLWSRTREKGWDVKL
jgi:hypothetical protein